MNNIPAIINLESLVELSARLNNTQDSKVIMNAALLSLMGKLKVPRACILIENNNGSFGIFLSKGSVDIDHIPVFKAKNLKELDDLEDGENLLLEAGFKFCMPIKYGDISFAMICLGNKIGNPDFSLEEKKYANLVCTITANALQNAKNHLLLIEAKNKADKRNQMLATMFEMSRDFSSLLSKDQIISMLSHSLMGQLMVSRFAVFLYNESGGHEAIINRFEFLPDDDVLEELSKLDRILSLYDLKTCCGVEEYLMLVDAKVISPMMVSGRSKGLLVIGKKMNGGRFGDRDFQFIEALANTSISALENVRLFHEELEKKRLESELSLALEIQKNLLPKTVPQMPNFEIAGLSIPSRHVGGDYYDFIKLSEDKLLIVIADVSGKGMPAALIMASVQAALRVLVPLNLPILELIRRINEILYQNTAADKYITFFCGILDVSAGVFNYINAGHNPPVFCCSKEGISQLREGGLILGFTDEPYEYSNGTVRLSSGDFIVFYTDGVPDSLNSDMKEYGEARLRNKLQQLHGHSAGSIIGEIIDDVNSHVGGASQYDDITIVVLKGK